MSGFPKNNVWDPRSKVGLMHNFAGMVPNEDNTWKFDQIPHGCNDHFLDLRDFLIYIIFRK